MKFQCVDECAQCCIERGYFPSKEFGKIGVLILPEEKERIEKRSAAMAGNRIKILPRIGVSEEKNRGPTRILAYQLMGVEDNGNTCPFLDTGGDEKSPHGGFPCKIYKDRPLACAAYPLIESNPINMDAKCRFCKENKNADENLNEEIESLLKIKEKMATDARYVWRYATGIGEPDDRPVIKTGWILDDDDDDDE